MTAASLSLLKGGKKNAGAAKAAAPAPEPEPEPAPAPEPETAVMEAQMTATDTTEEEATFDVDTMDEPAIDAMVKEFGIEVPETWGDLNLNGKRKWLKDTFDDTSGGDAAETPSEAPAPEAASEAPVAEAPTEAVAEPAPAPEAEKATKGKGKGKGTAVAKNTTKTGTVIAKGDDVLSDLVHEIETLKQPQALGLVKELSEQTEVTFFRLGGVLSRIQANGWFQPYASFREFVEKEHGLHYRKATYWIGIYNDLAESGVPWSKVSHLGWTKLKEIAGVIKPDNVDEWVKIAEAQNTITLIDTVKKHLSKGSPTQIEDQSSKTVTTKTFKVHEGQKEVIEAALDKARKEVNTTVDTVALEHICGDFLSSITLEQRLKTLGIEKAAAALEAAFPNATIEISLTEEDGAADAA